MTVKGLADRLGASPYNDPEAPDRRAAGSDLLSFDCFDVDVCEAGRAAERIPGCSVTEVETVFRSGEFWRFPWRQTGHQHRAAGPQNPAHLGEGASRVGPEMNYAHGECAIEGGVGKRHPLRRAEAKRGPARGDKSRVEGGSFRNHRR